MPVSAVMDRTSTILVMGSLSIGFGWGVARRRDGRGEYQSTAAGTCGVVPFGLQVDHLRAQRIPFGAEFL